MATVKFTQPWGWSKLDVYDGCPQQFKYRYIDKLKEPGSPAMERGSKIHGQLEQYVNGWTKEFPAEVNKFWKNPIWGLKGLNAKTEAAWGIDKNWKPLKNWFEKDTWCRAKSDVYYVDGDVLILIDFKTGKYRIPSDEQIKLYAVIGHAMLPMVKRVRTSFWFVDQAEAPHEQMFEADDLEKMRGYFNKRAALMYKDRSFKPKPGQACRYCAFSRQKNGPCKY